MRYAANSLFSFDPYPSYRLKHFDLHQPFSIFVVYIKDSKYILFELL